MMGENQLPVMVSFQEMRAKSSLRWELSTLPSLHVLSRLLEVRNRRECKKPAAFSRGPRAFFAWGDSPTASALGPA